MRIVRFEPWHLREIRLQPQQAHINPLMAEQDYGPALAAWPSFTALGDDDRVIACAGAAPRWDNVAMAWAMMACDAGRNMVGIVKAARGFLDHAAPWRRIEAAVDVGFTPGERLVTLLGFEREGLARAYRPDGADCTIWAKIRPSSGGI